MISSLSSTCRRRRALRAALVTLIALTGCQGSMRTWRRDDPSLHDLVVTPHPWDEPATRDKPSSADPYAYRSRAAKAKSGRANPYSQPASQRQRFEPTDDVAEVGDSEEPPFAVEDAEFKALISQAEPAHRALLVQLYQAIQASRHAGAQSEATEDSFADSSQEEHPEHLIEPPQLAQSQSKPNSRSTSKNKRQISDDSGAVRYTYHDDSQVRPASATRHIDAGDLGNQPTSSRQEPVHYQINDAAENDATESDEADARARRNTAPLVAKGSSDKSSTKLQEMKPPTKSRATRPMVQEPVADTGYEEPIQGMSTPRGPREDAYATSSRKHAPSRSSTSSTNTEIDENYTDNSYVAQASHEVRSGGEPSVQPATLRPSARANSSAPATSPARSNGDTGPNADSADHEDWLDLAQRALRAIDRAPVDSSDNAQLNRHMTKRILFVLVGQLDQALEPIPNLKPHEQEYFRHSLTALYNAIDPRGNPVLARRWPLVLEDERTAMSHLSAESNLEVKNAAFCSHVDGFGSVTKFPNYQFRPNQELLLYCEVDNFVSTKVKNGYETKLSGNYQIVDANQTRVADLKLQEETDLCMSQRRDYFFVYRIYTPANIAPGRYQLRLNIEDMKGNKWGQTSLDMQIVGQ